MDMQCAACTNTVISTRTKQQVCVECPLMRLIHHHTAVAGEQQLQLQLAQQDAICHEAQRGLGAYGSVVPHLRATCETRRTSYLRQYM